MSVDIGDVLHVLAHELRTPVGIAHGYVRLLLEDRLTAESDRRRALEQLQKALARLTDLSHESSALANWFEREDAAPVPVGARSILDAVVATPIDTPVETDLSAIEDAARVTTADRQQLEQALSALVRATARELRGAPCTVIAATRDGHLDMLIGKQTEMEPLAAGPGAPDASPIEIDRGGVGLALVHARVVLDVNGGTTWSRNRSRQAVGVRLPLS